MFNIEHLNALRAAEIEAIVRHFRPGARILEIGAGTGKQAAEIAARGFDVEAIEIPDGNYTADRLFPITDYDGIHIPFPENSFDVVFSSNVLEHVPDLFQMHAEIRRVLRPGGYCIHVLPTHAWRFWTTLSAFPAAVQYAGTLSEQLYFNPRNGIMAEIKRLAPVLKLVAQHLSAPLRQRRHGERGDLITEMWFFRPGWWRANFRRNGFNLVRDLPMGLFYTGNMVFNRDWSIEEREDLAKRLGSACHLFHIVPTQKKPALALPAAGAGDATIIDFQSARAKH